MGYYSFTKADVGHTKVANIMYGAPFKLLIPAEFGGGSIKDHYHGSRVQEYDMFELLAFWNSDAPYLDSTVGAHLLHDVGQKPMKPVDIFTDDNRNIGIEIGTYDDQVDALKYPLKLVSASYQGTYEDCPNPSYSDQNQGCNKLSWKEYELSHVEFRQLRLV